MKAFIHVNGITVGYTNDSTVPMLVNIDHIITVTKLVTGKARLKLVDSSGPRDVEETYEQIVQRIENAVGVFEVRL